MDVSLPDKSAVPVKPLRICNQCSAENPDQPFCGSCGSPLELSKYISTRIQTQLAESIRDRDVLEMDSSIKVFTKAMSWIKLVLGIATALLIIVGFGFAWKASDLWKSVDRAKQSVNDTATKSSADIATVASQSAKDISDILDSGKRTIGAAATDATRRSEEMKNLAIHSKAEIAQQTKVFESDLQGSRHQLEAANQLQPQMADMQKQLARATEEIQATQKTLSSSEEFVKSVFSTHTVEFFVVGLTPQDHYYIIPPPSGGNRTVVLLLLQSVPIQGTVQLQYHIFVQPPNSYFNIKNLIVFSWADPPDNLKNQALSVSYFPDRNDRDTIHALSPHDGRVFADDQPLPKFNAPDPDFRGNKWMSIPPPPTKP